MNHIKLNDDFRNKLLESAAWGKIGLGLNEGQVEQGQDSLNESVDAQGYENIQDEEQAEEDMHVCPLCTSIMAEPIEEERVLEHLEIVASVIDRISQINESEEADITSIIEDCVREVLLENEENDLIDEDEDYEVDEDEFDQSEDDDVVEEEMDPSYMPPKGNKPKGKGMNPKGKGMNPKGKGMKPMGKKSC
jgi:hypothetical protein